jgi:hypothetical protein
MWKLLYEKIKDKMRAYILVFKSSNQKSYSSIRAQIKADMVLTGS